MALNYEKVIAVLSQEPRSRKDFEVNNLLPWFRKKSDLFKSLKTDILFDVIKHCQFVTKRKDDVFIRQGEQGDCMYILMRGKVTIYIQYANKGDTEEEKAPPPPPKKEGESERAQLGTFVVSLDRKSLGTFVTSLGQGATFGEVALLSEDCIRTASIITDEISDLIIVDRELYNRSVKTVLQKEFEDKSNFVSSNPFFKAWSPKYKKQLTMALQKDSIAYDGCLTRQGEPVSAMYFIISGEVKVVMDPLQHRSQYPKLFHQEINILENGHAKEPKEQSAEEQNAEELMKTMAGENHSATDRARYRRAAEKKKQLLEICFLGVNECIGDMEVLLDLDTCMQTTVCTQKTEVLVLEMKHWERLLVKRNPRTIEAMKEDLDLRLKSRISKHVEKQVPLLTHLLSRAEEYREQKQLQNEARQNRHKGDHGRSSKTMAQSFDEFIPNRGPLIDIHGPGTVFYKIREREKARKKKPRALQGFRGGPGFAALAAATLSKEQDIHPAESDITNMNGGDTFRLGTEAVDYQTSDPVLSNLEDRMKAWLANDGSKAPPRVMKLQRSQTEVNDLRPGAKVRVRPKHMQYQPAPPSDISQDGSEERFIRHAVLGTVYTVQ